jgi:hypothetical protein
MTKLSFADIEIIKREHPLTKVAREWVKLRAQRQGEFPYSGPCPMHSPDPNAADSTSFACNDEAWVCTQCGGGDVLSLVALRHGLHPKKDFLKAIDILTGGAPVKQISAEEARAIEEAKVEQAAIRTAEQNEFRDRERRAAWDLYFKFGLRLGHPKAAGALRYLNEKRGLNVGPEILLRFNPEARFYVSDRPKPRLIHTGPALLGMIRREGHFAGVHMTFLDFNAPKGKAHLVDPKTNQPLDAKKVRGSMKGGHIELTHCPEPHTLFLGEGKEKVLAVYTAWRSAGRDLAGIAFWSAMNLGNIGGKHVDQLAHPTMKTQTGRVQRVPGPTPDMNAPAIIIPDSVTRLVLLGDATSDRFTTESVMARAAARYAREGREVVCAWGPGTDDFDDLLREAA